MMIHATSLPHSRFNSFFFRVQVPLRLLCKFYFYSYIFFLIVVCVNVRLRLSSIIYIYSSRVVMFLLTFDGILIHHWRRHNNVHWTRPYKTRQFNKIHASRDFLFPFVQRFWLFSQNPTKRGDRESVASSVLIFKSFLLMKKWWMWNFYTLL